MKVALYIRVSTERQANEGDSLEEQENELKKFCDYKNYKIYNTYIERGKSGGNTNRPEYQKLLKAIKQKKINAVVVKKLDRLSRSLLDFENLMKTMREHEVEFISLKESFDTTTAMGKAMLRVALVFAQLEREQTSERIADVMCHRASQGMFNGGRRLFGYSIVEKELVPYPKEKEAVELMFKKFIETRSTNAVMHFLNQNGFKYRNGKNWNEKRIHQMLQNEGYLGKIKWGGKVYDGIHEPIISRSTFEKVQEIFASRCFVRAMTATNLMLTKKVYCSQCGSSLAPSHSLNRSKKRYFYYRCTKSKDSKQKCSRPQFSQTKLDNRVSEILISLSEDQNFRPFENKLLKHNEAIQNEIAEKTKVLNQMELELSQLKVKKDKYLDNLLLGQFSSKERNLISSKIEELELDEKSFKSAISKQKMAIQHREEDMLPIYEIKKNLVEYRTLYPFSDPAKHNAYSAKIITKIIVSKTNLKIDFQYFPWTEEFDINF